jgi:hypothetical protein
MVATVAGEPAGLVRLQAAVVLAVVLLAHGSLAPFVADADSFYHLGHAAHYAAAGLFDTAFPWATASVIGDLGGDLWWGFHMVLLPFAGSLGLVDGIRAAALVSTSLLAAVVWWVLRRHAVRGAGWWTALFLVASPNVLYRYLMVRPHVLSLALALLLLSFLARGRWWQLVLISAAMTWLHVSLFWMAPGIVVAYALSRTLVPASSATGGTPAPADPGVPALRAWGAVLAGTLLGALLRPHPLATAELAWIQIVQLFAVKGSDRPLLFATELQPLPVLDLVRSSWSFLLVWASALVAAWGWRGAAEGDVDTPPVPLPERRVTVAAVLVAGVFLALTLASARRALVEFTAFGFLLLPLAWTHLVPAGARRRVAPALALLLVAHLVWGAQRHQLNARFVAEPPDRLAEAAAWLAANSEPGDVVFHAHWDNFGPLFARNRLNRYLGGMDPIFQYAHDPGLYWEYFFLSADATTDYTCDAFPCFDGEATATWSAIRHHFGARWVVVEPARNPKLTRFLEDQELFRPVLRTQREIVFEVVIPDYPPPPAAPGVGPS